VVGILGFVYTNYSTCRGSIEVDNKRFDRLMTELGFRMGVLTAWPSSENPTAQSLSSSNAENKSAEDRSGSQSLMSPNAAQKSALTVTQFQKIDTVSYLEQIMNPEITYLFNEFKSKFPDEVTYEAEGIIKKWYPVAYDKLQNEADKAAKNRSFPQYVEDILKASKVSNVGDFVSKWREANSPTKSSTYKQPYIRILAPGGLFDLIYYWRGIYGVADAIRQEGNPSHSLNEIKKWGDDLKEEAENYEKATNDKELIPVYFCIRRSI
jgi:hypothetical protein